MQEIKVQVHSGPEREIPAGQIPAGQVTERWFPIGRVVVGRRQDCDLVLDPEHELASGRHVAIECDGGRLFVEDLNSTNGTLVNGTRLVGRQAIAPEDRVVLGEGGAVLVAQLVDAHVDLLATIEGEGLDVAATFPGAVTEAPPAAREPSVPGPNAQNPSAARPVGLRTMGSMVQAAAMRQRRLTFLLAATAIAFLGTTLYLLARDAESSLEREALRAELRSDWARRSADAARSLPPSDDFQAVLASVADSVYVIIKRTERAGDSSRIIERGSGTAFSVAGGFLGTNGHVG